MKIFQPMLFVGLGGTGTLVGAELERRLRAELCGPDGSALSHLGGLQPYQLPDCLQFVYADYSEADLSRVPVNTVDQSLRAAYRRTSHITHDLLPRLEFDSSPEVTKMLRARQHKETGTWLPPRDGEPRVAPLRSGAGQLPTVGRAALFATLSNGPRPVLEPLDRAIDAIARSAGVLGQLGGGELTGCDVFVAFSVAGGTGSGIFLDYLHLISHAFQEKGYAGAKIYPLVVMPSAFPQAGGGGREAELNSARALVDLFRLVDEQNAPTAGPDVGLELEQDSALRIHYPELAPIRLRSGTVPTAFLFSRTAGIEPEDLRRSIVSLMMSLIGTELGDGRGPARVDDDSQTFAASFINESVRRASPAASGIGRQGVSTSLVASVTAPMDELASLISGRVLRNAVEQLGDHARPPAVPLEQLVTQAFVDSGLEELLRREALPIPLPDPLPRGGAAIEAALATRLSDMLAQLDDLQRRVSQRTADLAGSFNPRRAIERLLQHGDPFLLDRALNGDPQDGSEIGRLGFLRMLESRAVMPAAPAGVHGQPPNAPRIRRRLAGLAQARWGDEEVRTALNAQERWYRWRTRVIWHEGWRAQQPRWEQTARGARAEAARLVSAFQRFAEAERRAFRDQSITLYSDRTGVSYLLPPQRDLRHFYEDLTARLIMREGLPETAREADLVLRMVDGPAWQRAHQRSLRDPDGSVAGVKGQLEAAVRRLFAESGRLLEELPLLPSMSVLLAAAAGDPEAGEQVSRQAREQFDGKLRGLLPAGFTPQGSGPLKVLVVYPRVKSTDEVETFLRKVLPLPRDPRMTVQFRSVETESITVVLFRSQMSLTQVPEAREVLRQWAIAKDSERSEDVLRWRQRLGHQDDWLISTETDRQAILHRLLCALWNGQVDVLEGTEESPERIRVRLFPEDGPDTPGVWLRLGSYPDGISSWAELLRVYERWTVLDGERNVQFFCQELMTAQPVDLNRSGSKPHPLFVKLVEEIAPHQLRLLAERRERDGARIDGWVEPLLQFWRETLPAALDLRFTDRKAAQPTLRTLLEAITLGRPPAAREPEPARRSTGEEFGTVGVPEEPAGRAPGFDGPDTRARDYGSSGDHGSSRIEPGTDDWELENGWGGEER
ncbi:tubulin-like doman-containing protein [Kitasatospora viridis]|uniref:Tubulin-like protein n=1 Tax=Kitasatospora viridis TaxID=281105 RepID=A0A561SFF6_9ACTN|nr:tubulin-like doman-containing protein [Kitasatospora viridis]TWF73605.1 tubulin-like protein [Kitasatospora viridis]